MAPPPPAHMNDPSEMTCYAAPLQAVTTTITVKLQWNFNYYWQASTEQQIGPLRILLV